MSETATIFVLFGATGDLAKRMVLPAFYTLAQKGLLPADWRLIGNGRGDVAHEDFQKHVHDALEEFGPQPDPEVWEAFRQRLLFAGGGFKSDDPGSLLDVIEQARKEVAAEAGQVQFVHYLATPPAAFEETAKALGQHGLSENSRIVFEKPYGESPQSFRQLDETVLSVFAEEQVFRIDHFLGKEATQNLHVLRFANQMFAGIWCKEFVSAVQIDVPETLDIADRAQFYDATGATKDMLVTHLLQVAAEVAMEPPASMAAADLQEARESVIAAFRPLDPAEVVLGQFDGYRDTEGIAADSTTDTYSAARLWIDTDRWHGVPFLLRTGKRLAGSAQRVSLVLRAVEGPLAGVPAQGNVVTFSLAGSGELEESLVVKRPGTGLELAAASQKVSLDELRDGDPLPPYVALLNDVLLGDRSLFTSSSGLEHAWRVVAPLLDNPPPVQPYQPGSWGPAAADELAAPGMWLLG
ncbi:MAG TPA: glucose-6-phosphate dehydrogenase (NADP(+)) [Kineosporiaceae bacterium]|nr:glucose-6-phosphate dehydrogenase (NADP(+)) [Kineosporiaceae bacterium]